MVVLPRLLVFVGYNLMKMIKVSGPLKLHEHCMAFILFIESIIGDQFGYSLLYLRLRMRKKVVFL